MRNIIAWVVTVELLGVAVLPLLRVFFKNRRDSALLCRPIGLAIVAYLAWLLALIGLPFERGVVMFALLLVAVASFFVHRRSREDFPSPFWATDEKRAVLLFWASTAVFLIIRSAWPEILGQEKFMDLAFLNSLTRNVNMPPVDPWMSGRSINYYYWGYLLAAAETKLANVSTLVSYNLTLATFAGYSFVAAACLGLRLSRGRLAAGIGAAAGAVFAGNLSGAFDGWNYLLGRGFEYFHASRVIGMDPTTHDYTTISEFPFFTFFQADLHPHLLAFPYFIAAFAVGQRFLVREPAATPKAAPGVRGILSRWSPTLLFALVAGTSIAANLWTLPAIGILIVTVCVFRATRGTALPRLVDALLGLLGGLALLLAAYLLWWSYEHSFSLTTRDPNQHGIAGNTMTSGLLEFLGVWGIFLAVALATVWPRSDSTKEEGGPRRDLAVAAAAAVSVLVALLTRAPAMSVLLWIMALVAAIEWRALRETHDADEVFVAFLLLLGLSIVTGCEFIHFKDSYGERLQRMNTIFKFYNQAWPLIAISVAVSAEKLWRQMQPGVLRSAYAVFLAGAALVACLYPAAAISQRLPVAISEHQKQHEPLATLDARAALEQRNPADAAAIAWIERNVHGAAVLLEATGDPYSEYARMSSHTGIPTVMGWANHEGLWRENLPEIGERMRLVQVFYTTSDPSAAYEILRKYRVTHVVLGDLESRTYRIPDAITTFPFLMPVFNGATTILQVVKPETPGQAPGEPLPQNQPSPSR